MKRSPPSDIQLARPSFAKRWRTLSEEERALWEEIAKSTRPLKARQRKPKPSPPEAVAPVPGDVPAVPPSSRPARPAVTEVPAAPRAKPVPPLVPLGRRERSQLSRGKKDIEARLDLHGMTQARAHGALRGFLRQASEDGMTFVLVITGKGRTGAPEGERGVLRRQVPEWLSQPEFRAFVVGFEEAHISHGGGGALYLRIRRRAVY